MLKLKRTLLLAAAVAVVGTAASLLGGCSGNSSAGFSAAAPNLTAPDQAAPADATPNGGFPYALPVDYQQPWEQLDGSGQVVPQPPAERGLSAITADSEFRTGVDRFSESGDVSDLDQASSIGSGAVGASQVSNAIYRLEMGGDQPGAVSVDINIKARSDGSLSDYWLGISDYDAGVWQWNGPFTDGQARLSLAPGNYLSGLGNLFVAVVAFDGSAFDVVGVAANPRDEMDSTAPPAPSAPVLTPVSGGVLMVWLSVAAGDLAGYRIYSSSAPFTSAGDSGVQVLNYLDASRRFVLKHSGHVYVRISAVDISGNESALSPQADATALAGDPLEVVLTTDLVSGLLGDTANLVATGAATYDFDLNGDGVFEITGDATGMAVANTDSTGIIRPRVRASSGDGSAKALGAVSLIIAAQLPPVAMVAATPNEGVLWREPETVKVTLDASMSYDEDGASLEYAFDPLGDGTYTAYGPTDNYDYDYTEGGTYLAAVRVRDDDMLVAQASALVTVRQVSGFYARDIEWFNNKGQFCSMAIADGNPAIVMIDGGSGFLLYKRATDPGGNLWGEAKVIDPSGSSIFMSLKIIAGNPAVSYYSTGAGEVRYLRADDAAGSSWTNAPVVVEGPIASSATTLADVNGNPAVAYVDGASDLRYRRATSAAATGDTAADWADAPFTIDNSGNIGGFASLTVISGDAAVAYWDSANSEVLYKRAVTATGASGVDWPVLPARASPGGVFTNGHISLLEVTGRPAVCFHETGIGSLQYVRALNNTGAVTADWPIVAVQVATGGNCGEWNSMALIDGRPCVSYVTMNPWMGLFYSRARDEDGSAFEPRVTVMSDPAQAVGQNSSMVEIDGLPAICYWNASHNNIGFATPTFN